MKLCGRLQRLHTFHFSQCIKSQRRLDEPRVGEHRQSRACQQPRGSLLYLLLGPLGLSHLEAESLHLLILAFHLLLFVTQLTNQALLRRPVNRDRKTSSVGVLFMDGTSLKNITKETLAVDGWHWARASTWGLWASRSALKTPAWPVFSGCGLPSAL